MSFSEYYIFKHFLYTTTEITNFLYWTILLQALDFFLFVTQVSCNKKQLKSKIKKILVKINNGWIANLVILLYFYSLAKWVERSPMVRETRVQSQVESYQRLKRWYLMLPWLALSFIRYGSRLKWSNPRNRVAPSPTPRCSSYWKGSLWVTLH